MTAAKTGPVIAVSGPPGAGKSTLCHALAAQIKPTALIEYDAYETMTRQPPAAVEAWLARGAPIDEIETPGLVEAIRAAAYQGTVVFETPMGRAHPESGRQINLSIWLDCPNDVALARKISQFIATNSGGDAVELDRFHGWLSGYLDSYVSIVRPACEIQRQRVMPLADLRLDALAPVESHISAIIGQIDRLD